ncbi:MAG: leucyl aminopeptidase family protein [Bacteroidia bacterium]|nr:leucyl aminopeptidase family protein [Bacteroidia bacterium]
MMDYTVISQIPETVSAIVFPFFKGEMDTDRVKQLSGLNFLPEFEGKLKETTVLFHPDKPLKIILAGLGERREEPKAPQVFRSVVFRQQEKWGAVPVVYLEHLPVEMVFSAAVGAGLAQYKNGFLKTGTDENKNNAPVSLFHRDNRAAEFAEEGFLTADTQVRIMQLVDTPSNTKNPEWLGQFVRESAQKYGYTARVYDREALESLGLFALLAVGQGSKFPPVLIQIEYKPEGFASDTPRLGLVGKGITFDTGGISIKPSTNMHFMKSDMGGAAAVIGAVELAARLRLPIHIVGVIPSAENSVDADSFKPGDVISSYAGKTIEIIDTDAEGRLVLADGLAWMQKQFSPEIIIDLATLTGSCVQTLGYSAAGMFTENDSLAQMLTTIGQAVHERVWRLPLFSDFEEDLHSDVADVRNFSGKPVAGAITAAKFLEYFIKDHPQWVHLDIAGVSFGDSEFTKMRAGTGYGVRLLTHFMKHLISQ